MANPNLKAPCAAAPPASHRHSAETIKPAPSRIPLSRRQAFFGPKSSLIPSGRGHVAFWPSLRPAHQNRRRSGPGPQPAAVAAKVAVRTHRAVHAVVLANFCFGCAPTRAHPFTATRQRPSLHPRPTSAVSARGKTVPASRVFRRHSAPILCHWTKLTTSPRLVSSTARSQSCFGGCHRPQIGRSGRLTTVEG